jgi:3-oxoacyl-[acyl-carrier-protein] synthase-3
MVKSVLSAAGATADEVDAFVFHQANSFMLKHLARRMRLPENKVVLALEDYGNTSSASIPLTLTHVLSGRLKTESLLLALAGFGVGFSWGAAVLRCGPMVMSERVDVSC